MGLRAIRNRKIMESMSLEKCLSDKRSTIIKKWRDLVIGSYPVDTQRFFKKEKNRFSNPVGQTIMQDVEILYDELTVGHDLGNISSSLDNIIRIRAIQDFKPSQAIGFVLQLKKLIRDELVKDIREKEILKGIETLEQQIDNMALLAFDIYSRCRQRLYEIRIKETKNQVDRLLRRANLTIEIPEHEPDL